ncbi:MAG: hypothetical protein N4A33_11740 [Bacteriovoracaceae bacterium]|jgi:hypothetical protein|nr:hypothetical protein [Bacteriovoracaceae bacterium]
MKLILIITAFASSLYATCNTRYKLRIPKELGFKRSEVIKIVETQLTKKGYVIEPSYRMMRINFHIDQNNGHANAKVTIRNFFDYELENYTHGYGVKSKNTAKALKLNNYKKALKNAISHQPDCK